ncbi:MAG: GAF domain-containing protein [Chloroflexales bacterium]|nr:GAF domain-containing protein [Chloroflexales bacterium]
MKREQLQVTLASIGDAVIAIDVAERIVFMNAVAARLTGWAAAEAHGRPISTVFRVVRTPTLTLLLARDGSAHPIDTHAALMSSPEGASIGAVLVVRDLAAREQVETAHAEALAHAQAARIEAEQAHGRATFLAEASRLLAGDLDYPATLHQVADLMVPRMADWCVVDLLDDAGVIQMVAAAHRDPAKVVWAYELRRQYPIDPNMPVGAPYVIRTGKPQIFRDIPDALLEAVARTPHELRLLRTVGYRSLMIVPLRARERVLGSISFVIAESERRYTSEDLTFAEELADRAALSIDNAILYQSAQEARSAAERAAEQMARLQRVTAALVTTNTAEQAADVITREGLAAIEADSGALFVLSKNGLTWEAISFCGYPPELVLELSRSAASEPGPLRDALEARALVAVETPQGRAARWPNLARVWARSGDAATVAVPLLLDQRLLGVLYAAFRAPRRFSADDRAFLEALARQGAQALDHARLYEAERLARTEAEAASQLRDHFLSVAAHELKTPLTSLKLQTHMLQRRVTRASLLSAQDQRTLGVVVSQVRRLEQLIGALLDSSRLEFGQLSLVRAPVDLCALTRRVLAEVQLISERHQFAYHGPETGLIVDGDELRLEQVLQNLLQNAIKYSPNGGLVAAAVSPQDGMVCVVVTDQGIGIPEEALSQIFERFYRAPNADQQQISGMGIGLYVVREIVQLHDGRVSAARQQGGGSRFTVCLPQLRPVDSHPLDRETITDGSAAQVAERNSEGQK